LIAIQHLEPGTRIRIAGGVLAEIVENPRDGMWLLVRWISAPADKGAPGTEELCHADQVLEVAGP
jgi:hypothetical protein